MNGQQSTKMGSTPRVKASEYLLAKDTRQGLTTFTYHDKKLTVPDVKATRDTSRGHVSVMMSAQQPCKECNETLTASLGRRKQKVVMKPSSSAEDVSLRQRIPTEKGHGALGGGKKMKGKMKDSTKDGRSQQHRNPGGFVQGEVEERKLEFSVPSGASHSAIRDVIVKARNMASDHKFHDGSCSDNDCSIDLDIDEALRDERFTEEFKGAVEELRMVPQFYTSGGIPHSAYVTWPRRNAKESVKLKQTHKPNETSDYETLDKEEAKRHKYSHIHHSQKTRIGARQQVATKMLSQRQPPSPTISNRSKAHQPLSDSERSPKTDTKGLFKPVIHRRIKIAQFSPSPKGIPRSKGGNVHLRLGGEKNLTLQFSSDEDAWDDVESTRETVVSTGSASPSGDKIHQNPTLDTVVIPDIDVNLEKSFQASMEDIFQQQERDSVDSDIFDDGLRSSSPESLVEQILDDTDSEVYEENVLLNRIFSVRKDFKSGQVGDQNYRELQKKGKKVRVREQKNRSSFESSPAKVPKIDSELNDSGHCCLEDQDEGENVGDGLFDGTSKVKPETHHADLVTIFTGETFGAKTHGDQGEKNSDDDDFEAVGQNKFNDPHFEVNDSPDECCENILESLAAIEEEEDEEMSSGEYDADAALIRADLMNIPEEKTHFEADSFVASECKKHRSASCEAVADDAAVSKSSLGQMSSGQSNTPSDSLGDFCEVVPVHLSTGAISEKPPESEVQLQEQNASFKDITENLPASEEKLHLTNGKRNQRLPQSEPPMLLTCEDIDVAPAKALDLPPTEPNCVSSIPKSEVLQFSPVPPKSGGIFAEQWQNNGTTYITETVDLKVVRDHPVSPLVVKKEYGFDAALNNGKESTEKTKSGSVSSLTYQQSPKLPPAKPKKVPPPVPPRGKKSPKVEEAKIISSLIYQQAVPKSPVITHPKPKKVPPPVPRRSVSFSAVDKTKVGISSVIYQQSQGSKLLPSEKPKAKKTPPPVPPKIRRSKSSIESSTKSPLLKPYRQQSLSEMTTRRTPSYYEGHFYEGKITSPISPTVEHANSNVFFSNNRTSPFVQCQVVTTNAQEHENIQRTKGKPISLSGSEAGLEPVCEDPTEGDDVFFPSMVLQENQIITCSTRQINKASCDVNLGCEEKTEDTVDEVMILDVVKRTSTSSFDSISTENSTNSSDQISEGSSTNQCPSSELRTCLSEVCETGTSLDNSEGVVLSEEVITQEITLVVAVPKKNKEKKMSTDVVKKDKPVRDLNLHRVTRLTDFDVEVLDGDSISECSTNGSIGQLVDVDTDTCKIPLAESLEQHSQEKKMPLVVEIRDSSTTSSAVSSPSLLSPRALSPETCQPLINQESNTNQVKSDRTLRSRSSSTDSLRQELKSPLETEKPGSLRRGLRSPMSPVPMETQYEQKEKSTVTSQDANMPMNIQREDSLKIIQVPPHTDTFVNSLQDTISRMSSLLLREISLNKNLAVKIDCEARETFCAHPGLDSVQTLAVKDTLVDTTASRAIKAGTSQEDIKNEGIVAQLPATTGD